MNGCLKFGIMVFGVEYLNASLKPCICMNTLNLFTKVTKLTNDFIEAGTNNV